MELEVLSINYCVPVSIEQFEKLDRLDYLEVVQPAMEKAGASKIEFNGHFGANVFFTAEAKDAPAVVAAIEKLIR